MFTQMRYTAVAGVVCLLASVCLGWSPVQAENRVRVDSVTTYPGNTVQVGVFISNDVEIQNFCIPLIVTSLSGGAFWMAMEPIPINVRGNPPGATPIFNDALVDYVDPDQVKLGWLKGMFDPGMSAGSDAPDAPTWGMTVTVTPSVGIFEIDTLIFPPACVLSYTDMTGLGVQPEFTKGIVTIEACDCPDQGNVDTSAPSVNIMDIIEIIEYVFRSGPPLIQDPDCPANRGDWNCDGPVNVLDMVAMIGWWAGTREGGPCDPCACSPYPTNCPPPE